MNNSQMESIVDLAAVITRYYPESKPFVVRRVVIDLAKIARTLHKRYEAACSYEWANTEKYERATEKLESKASKIATDNGLTIGFQRDPRGWPLIIYIDNNEYRLG